MTTQASLLGLPDHLDNERINSLVSSLSSMWRLSMGSEIGDLLADLDSCKRWFDPVAQGQRLRRELAAIPPLPDRFKDPGPPYTIAIRGGRSLVTPEGRCALDLLLKLSTGRKGHQFIGDDQLVPYDRILARTYKEWSRRRINSVVRLLAGEAKPLQIAAAGVVLAILVNRSTSPSRPLVRFPAGAARDVIDDAFFRAVRAFSQTLSPKQRPTRDPRLISGWMLYEARRRLGDDVLIIDGARPDTEGRIWIQEGKQEQVTDLVARDLARGHRTKITSHALASAFDSLVGEFRNQLSRLAGFGVAHERPTNTARLRDSLIGRFQAFMGE